jgi:hypothetical protein
LNGLVGQAVFSAALSCSPRSTRRKRKRSFRPSLNVFPSPDRASGYASNGLGKVGSLRIAKRSALSHAANLRDLGEASEFHELHSAAR